MNDKIEILTKIYGYVNRIKVCLSFRDIAGIWKAVNGLSDYLVSVDVFGWIIGLLVFTPAAVKIVASLFF